MSYDLAKFKHGLEELRIALTDHQIEQFLQYYEMLVEKNKVCLLYTSPSPRDGLLSRMPSSA